MSHAADLFVPNFVIPFKPRAVILYEGSNDLNANEAPEEIFAHFQRLHQQIHEALPNTRLYVLGIVPSPGKRFQRWDAIKETNALIKEECQANPWIKFIDTTTPLISPKGMPRPECFIENDIHMNEVGYEVWKSVVAPIVVPAETPFEVSDQR
jgi:lysophospholipase L1-like esterase